MAGKIVKTDSVSLEGNETIANALEGTKLENVPSDRNYNVNVFATASTADVRMGMDADTDVAIQDSLVSSQDRVPLMPDDFVEAFAVTGGSKLFLELNETAGAEATFYYKIVLTPRR